MNMFIRMTVAIVLLWSSLSSGQVTVHGVVRDRQTGDPIQSTTIFIPQLQRGAVSDSGGAFEFKGLPPTAISFQISREGYHSVLEKLEVVRDTTIDVRLVHSFTELEEVVVTSNQSKLPQQCTAPINTLPINDVKKYGAPSLMANLSYQPGVDRIGTGVGIGKPVIRGLSFNRILLYGQGTRIENQQWDDRHDLGLTDIGVSTVEIVRGPAAVVYGADALGGALIFSGEKPVPAGTVSGDAGFGFTSNTLGISGDAGVRGTGTNGFFYGIRLGAASHTSYLQGEQKNETPGETEAFAPNSKFLYGTGKLDLGWSKKWGVSKLSYSCLRQGIGIVEDESDTGNQGNDEAEQRERELEAPYQDVLTQILSSENTIITGSSKLNINVALQSNDRSEFEPLPGKLKEKAYGLALRALTYDVRWSDNELKNGGMTLGTQGLIMTSRNNGLESLVPDAAVRNFGAYALYRYDIGRLNLLAGARLDHRMIEAESYEPAGTAENDTFIDWKSNAVIYRPEIELTREYLPFSFSAGVAYHTGEHTTFKMNVSSGFTAPNYAQLGAFGKHEGAYRFERGNAGLSPEENIQLDGGFMWEGEAISIDVGLYNNLVNNYCYLQNTGDSMVQVKPTGRDTLSVYEYKQGAAMIKGGEITVDMHPPQVDWMDMKLCYALIDASLKSGAPLPYIPANKFTGEVRLSTDKLWKLSDASVSLVVSSLLRRKNVAEYERSTEGYTLIDLYSEAVVSVFHQPATVGLYCTNVLNTGYFNQLSLLKYIGVRDMGRNIGLRLRVPFGIKKK